MSLIAGAAAMILMLKVVQVSFSMLETVRVHALAERAVLMVASRLTNGAATAEQAADRLLATGPPIMDHSLDWQVDTGTVSVSFVTVPNAVLGLGGIRVHASALLN